ncbi:hypothetical protein [Paenibacillus radicis (ex Xue et al. 2023)]|uniref:Uncharacterized protein n=1 Tax=Paenibacillus radicis (ex Xue et al. 2023) TaxID=2972489 RepID=A0ABT1YM12_9BACL|nr:hypothetical protein [Paenibacillus radicis (ex Xue et al. 2023)]MCR8634216.1 hypothetical protein [Paenibacillus radicis (ex Xue et al. 2023)]
MNTMDFHHTQHGIGTTYTHLVFGVIFIVITIAGYFYAAILKKGHGIHSKKGSGFSIYI